MIRFFTLCIVVFTLILPTATYSQKAEKTNTKFDATSINNNAFKSGFYLVADTNAIGGNINQVYSDCGECDARFHVIAYNYYDKNIDWTLVSAPTSYSGCGNSFFIDSYNCIDGDCTFHMHGVSPGEYIIAAKDLDDPDSLNSVVSDTILVIIRAVNNGSVTSSTNDLLCHGDLSGGISVQTILPVPITYLWNTGDSTSSLTGLSAGTYTITITDADKCELSESISITEPTWISITPIFVNNQIPGPNSGAIDLIITGGTSPYSYKWSNGATTQQINQLAAGTYAVIVMDANNCAENRMYRLEADSIQSTGLDHFEYNASIKIYPNPFSETIQFDLTTDNIKEMNVRVISLLGNVVYEHTYYKPISKPVELNLSPLPKGIYFLKLTGNRLNKTLRLIKHE